VHPHRPRKVFELGGQTGVKTKSVLGGGYGNGSPTPTTGVRVFNPRKILEICAKFGILG